MVWMHRTRSRLTLLATGLLLAQGCAFFPLGNPILPTARLTGEASPPLLSIKIVYQNSTKTFTTTATDPTVQVSSLPNDAAPGVTINRFSAEYTDNVGNPIDAIALAKSNLGLTYYMPPAANGTTSQVSFQLPIATQNLKQYALDHAYLQAGGITLNPFFPGTLACHVTLYAQDDNYNEIQIPLDVPISVDAQTTN